MSSVTVGWVRAMRGGAVDLLEKPLSDRDLLAAVRRGLGQDRLRKARRADREVLEARPAQFPEVAGLLFCWVPPLQATLLPEFR